jgi:Na+/phosphate symporter
MEDLGVWFRLARTAETKTDRNRARQQENSDGPRAGIVGIEEDLAIMIGRIEEMTRLLPACIVNCASSRMDECETLAQEVRRQAKVLTRSLVTTHMAGELPKGLIRFPLRLERIADEMDSILTCCRIKARDGVTFSDKAHTELDQMLAILLDMLENLRDVITTPNSVVLDYIISQGGRVNQLLRDARSVHWIRLETGQCTTEAGSLFLDMLDSLKSGNEYVQKLAATFLGLIGAGEESRNIAPENAAG